MIGAKTSGSHEDSSEALSCVSTVVILSDKNPHVFVVLQHLSEMFVGVGAVIGRNMAVGTMGDTGVGDVHLHMEVLFIGDANYFRGKETFSSEDISMNPWLFLP